MLHFYGLIFLLSSVLFISSPDSQVLKTLISAVCLCGTAESLTGKKNLYLLTKTIVFLLLNLAKCFSNYSLLQTKVPPHLSRPRRTLILIANKLQTKNQRNCLSLMTHLESCEPWNMPQTRRLTKLCWFQSQRQNYVFDKSFSSWHLKYQSLRKDLKFEWKKDNLVCVCLACLCFLFLVRL